MNELEYKLLKNLYDYYQETNSRSSQFNYPRDKMNNYVDKDKYINAFSNLIDEGLIVDEASAIGFRTVKITPLGISKIESL